MGKQVRFVFEDGTIVEIRPTETTPDGFGVWIEFSDKESTWTRIFGDFPNYDEAHEFVLFGDFEAPMENNLFLETTKKGYNLQHMGDVPLNLWQTRRSPDQR